MIQGCQARLACPVGREHAYRGSLAQHLMRAFRAAESYSAACSTGCSTAPARQQRRLRCLGALDAGVLDVAEAADLLRQRASSTASAVIARVELLA